MAESEIPAGQRSRDAAELLQWVGIALLGIFLTLLLASLWPVTLLQPTWLQRAIDVTQNLGINALLGAVLLVLAQLLDPQNERIGRRVARVRRLASWAALGFLLLVPLQAYTGIRLLKERARNEATELGRIERATKAIEAATTDAELRTAIGQLPGAPPNLPDRFNQPIGEVRDRLADQIRPRLKQTETRLAQAHSERWQAWLRKWLRDGIYSLFLTLGFAAIGQTAPGRPTLLRRLFRRNAGGLWKPFESPATGTAFWNRSRKQEGQPRKPSWLQKPPERGRFPLQWNRGRKGSTDGIPREWLPDKAPPPENRAPAEKGD